MISSINIVIIIIIIIIISTFITVSAGVLYVRQSGANHAPRASVTQVNLSVQILSTLLLLLAASICNGLKQIVFFRVFSIFESGSMTV